MCIRLVNFKYLLSGKIVNIVHDAWLAYLRESQMTIYGPDENLKFPR